MKRKIQKIIDDADLVCENHHEIPSHTLCEELGHLRCRLSNAEEDLCEAERCLEKAIRAVERVSDRYEMHRGGNPM
jgi:hypothetical protein